VSIKVEVFLNNKNEIIMLKNILNLEGAQEISASEQKTIVGGNAPVCEEGFVAKRCTDFGTVPSYWTCFPLGYVGGC
jgi:hypothetical protein